MSDKITEVTTDHGGIQEYGYLEPEEAIARLRDYYEHQQENAAKVLASIDSGEVRVFHQLGPWAARNRRQVYPEAETKRCPDCGDVLQVDGGNYRSECGGIYDRAVFDAPAGQETSE